MADLIITGGTVVTMAPDRRIYRDGAVAVEGQRIVAVGPTGDIRARHKAAETIDAKGKLVVPGFIDAHNHPNQYLSKGIGDDVDLMTWLTGRIWPYEIQMTETDAHIGALGNFIEMIRSGTTCFNDPGGYYPDDVARAATEVGIRGVINRSTRDRPEPDIPASPKLFENIETNLTEAEKLVKRWNGAAGGRIRAWYSLRWTLSVTDELAVRIKRLADRDGTGLHVHAAVGHGENELSLERFGKRSLVRLRDLGLLGSNLLLAHMGAPNQEEIGWLVDHDVKVVHCPSASMFGAYGVIHNRQIPEMVRRGVTVGLGTDSATAGRFLDMVRCMYLAACAHKDAYADPQIMGAYKALEMATIDGARACLWEDQIGSLEAGKLADIVLIDMSGIEWSPGPDALRNLVYAANGTSVETVIIDGRIVMRDRVMLSVDEAEVRWKVGAAAEDVVKRAGIQIPALWPTL